MKKDKLKIGQKIIIIKKPHPTNAEVGDIAHECGFSQGEHQFHSDDLVETWRQRENYWVEFLPRDCYQLLEDSNKQNYMKNKELEKLIEDKQATLLLIKICFLDKFLRESMILAYNLKYNNQ